VRFHGADLSGATGAGNALVSSYYDEKTIWPDGFDPATNGLEPGDAPTPGPTEGWVPHRMDTD